MNIHQILEEYDSLFGKKTLDEIEVYLYEKIGDFVINVSEAATNTKKLG